MNKEIFRSYIITGLSAAFIGCYFLVSFFRNYVLDIKMGPLKGLMNTGLLFITNSSVDFILSLPFIIVFSYVFLTRLENRISSRFETNDVFSLFTGLRCLFKNVIYTFFWIGAVLVLLSCWFIAVYIRSEILEFGFLGAGQTVRPLISAAVNFIICMFLFIFVVKSPGLILKLIDGVFESNIIGYIRSLRG